MIDRSTPEVVVASFGEAISNQDVDRFRDMLDPDDSGYDIALEGFRGEVSAGIKIEMYGIELYNIK